jgi:glycine/D-amino acid oxidase-like deaminating enzyme
MKTDIVVIGSGLIGSMVTKYLREVRGMEVVIIDQKNTMAASKCSFGVWKEGWVNEVIQKEYKDGLELLDTFSGGIKEEEFIIKPKPYKNRSMVDTYEVKLEMKAETFKRVDCSLLLNEESINATVLSIDQNRVTILHAGKEQRKEVIVAKHIVVAAGVWTTDILTENGLMNNLPYLDRQWGAVFHLKGNGDVNLPASQMQEWAPYKQSVFVNLGNNRGVFGDGATIKNPKPNDDKVRFASDRIVLHMNDLLKRNIKDGKETYSQTKFTGSITEILEGYRPYLNKQKSHTGRFVNRHSDYVISATGGAKNSTILCGHMAKEVWRLIKAAG